MKEKKPTATLIKAMNEVKMGKVTNVKDVKDLLKKLKS